MIKNKKNLIPYYQHITKEIIIYLVTKKLELHDYNLQSNQIIYKNSFNFKKLLDFVYELKYNISDDKYVRGKMFNVSSRYSKNSKYINSAINKPLYFSS